jgi:hypothetical protein
LRSTNTNQRSFGCPEFGWRPCLKQLAVACEPAGSEQHPAADSPPNPAKGLRGHRERRRGAAILSMSEAVPGLGRTRFAAKQKALFARTELSCFQDRLDRICEARKIGGGNGTEVSRTRCLASACDETEKPALPLALSLEFPESSDERECARAALRG